MTARVTVNMGDAIRKTGRRLETVALEFTQDLAETVVTRTPVDTGFLRGSWFVSLGEDMATFAGEPDKSGALTIGRVSMDIARANVGTDIINILNSAGYADHVENGTSRMAPRAMVRSTVADAPQIFQDTIRRIRR